MPTRKNKKNTRFKTKKFRRLLMGGADTATATDIGERINFLKLQHNPKNIDDIKTTVTRIYNEINKTKASRGVQILPNGEIIKSETAPLPPAATYDNIVTNLIQKAEEFPTIKDNTLTDFTTNSHIVLCSLHGSHSSTKADIFKVVPMNTMICFLSGIDHLSRNTRTNLDRTINEELQSLDKKMYNALFTYNINYRNIDFDSTTRNGISPENYHYHSIYNKLYSYSCFKDSMWYFPGQIYPDLSLSVSRGDKELRGISFIEFNPTTQCTNHVNDTKFHNPVFLKNEFLLTEQTYTKNLHEIAEYDKPDITGNYKLIIVSSCRNIDIPDALDKSDYFQLELFTYHLNNKIINHNKDHAEPPNFYSIMSFETMKDYVLTQDINYYNLLNYDFANDNYSCKIPHLMKIKNKIETSTGPNLEKITIHDYFYLNSISFNKLYKFLLTINANQKEKSQRIKFIQNYIFVCYEQINHNFLKYLGIFDYINCYKQNLQDENSFSSLINSMFYLSVAFESYSGLESLFISDNFKKFNEDYQNLQFKVNMDVIHSDRLEDQGTHLVSDGEVTHIHFVDTMYEDLIRPNHRVVILQVNQLNISKFFPNVKKVIIYRIPNPTPSGNLLEVILEKFPNLEILIFKNCGDIYEIPTIRTNYHSLKVLKLINVNIVVNRLSFFPNLEFLEIQNNSCLETLLISENFKLSTLILSDLLNLRVLNITSLKPIDKISLTNIFLKLETIKLERSINTFIIRDSYLPKNRLLFRGNIRMQSLELINVKLSIDIFNMLRMQPYKYYSKLKISIPKLKMINVKFERMHGLNYYLIPKIKYFNFVEISGIYNDDVPIIFNDADLKDLRKKHFNMKINSNHISEAINPELLKNITLF